MKAQARLRATSATRSRRAEDEAAMVLLPVAGSEGGGGGARGQEQEREQTAAGPKCISFDARVAFRSRRAKIPRQPATDKAERAGDAPQPWPNPTGDGRSRVGSIQAPAGARGGVRRKRRPRGLWPQSSYSPSVLSAQLCGGPFLSAVGGLGHTPPSIQSNPKQQKKASHGRVIAFVTISSFSSSSSWSLSAGRQSGPSAPLSCSLARLLWLLRNVGLAGGALTTTK